MTFEATGPMSVRRVTAPDQPAEVVQTRSGCSCEGQRHRRFGYGTVAVSAGTMSPNLIVSMN